MRKEQLGFGNAGWVRYLQNEPPVEAYVRFADQGGRLVAVDLLFSSDAGIDTNTLRHFRIARVEALVNNPDNAASVRERMRFSGPLVREAASLYATSYGDREPLHWAKQMLWSQDPGSGLPRPKLPARSTPDFFKDQEVDLTVRIPVSRRYPDDFYREVAARYSWAALESRSPAIAIAQANEVPVATVHRWISEARRRGYLGAAQPGKAG